MPRHVDRDEGCGLAPSLPRGARGGPAAPRALGPRPLLPVLVVLTGLLPEPAHAAEVVWLEPPTDEDAARVAAYARATRGPLSAAGFRGWLARPGPAQDEALAEVARALEAVRVHETVLDGEKLILRGLEDPLSEVTWLPDPDARETVVRALLYQGFAADRFWGASLGTAPDAAPWRIVVDDQTLERPWLDAFALAPLRRADASDIREAPQREAYDDLRRTLARATRARVLAPDLPEGARLFVDGEEKLDVEDTTVLDLIPGRHWFHVILDGEVVAREALRLSPGQRHEVRLDIPEPDWQAFRRLLRTGEGRVPASFDPVLEALGGQVWVASGTGTEVEVWTVSPDGVAPVALPAPGGPAVAGEGALGDVALAAWGGLGVLHSPDFRDQDPGAVPPGGGVVTAVAPVGGLALTWDRGWLRYGIGLDVAIPLGEHHVALSGAARYRARSTPHLVLGHPLVQATLGYTVPYHWVGGLQGTVPLDRLGGPELLEVRPFVRAGVPPTLTRADGSAWEGSLLVVAGVGLGVRLRP